MRLLLFFTFLLAEVKSFYVSYFAFGSNMNQDLLERRTFSKEGSLKPERTILKDYQLVFNTGLGQLGMAASVEPCRGEFTHGLTYKLSLPQFNFLLASEGFPVGYKIEPVRVKLYDGGGVIEALTLRSGRGLISGKPSERYIKLLQKGAKDNGLDIEYQRFLDGVEPTGSTLSKMRK